MKYFASLILSLSVSMSAVASSTADLVLINANIRTLNPKQPRADAIAIADGKIIAVGKNDQITRLAGPKTAVINAKERLVLPGFNDAHVHFTGIGNQFSHLDARHVQTSDELLERIRRFAGVLPKGRWLLGGSLSADVPRPTLEQLDKASPNNPLLIYFSDPTSAIVNSGALKQVRIKSESGVVRGKDVAAIRSSVPSDYERNWAEIAETASNYAASLGITSVQDVHSDDLVAVFRELNRQGRLKTRIYECIGIDKWRELAAKGIKAASGNAMVRNGCVKGVAHGETSEIDELKKIITDADRAMIQIKIHAIGRMANEIALEAFEYAARVNGPRDRRFVVEHATRFSPDLTVRFARAKLVASMQPHLFYYPGSSWSKEFRSILDANVPLAFGSDASITDFNPLYGIYAAVHPIGDRSLSIEQAIRAFTVGSAYSEYQEHVKGTLEIGKLADLVILSDDIFAMDVESIRNVSIVTTIVDGHVVFDSTERVRVD